MIINAPDVTNTTLASISEEGERGWPRRVAERVGRRMRAWQVGQAMDEEQGGEQVTTRGGHVA